MLFPRSSELLQWAQIELPGSSRGQGPFFNVSRYSYRLDAKVESIFISVRRPKNSKLILSKGHSVSVEFSLI
ncbi:hypothetical protein EAF04_006423 [Stromatinia cepivora]|nr:hypothetical protein EAF04_006423 [Stromatinia cepivora]